MKRPLVVFAFSYMLSVFIASFIGDSISVILSVLIIIFLGILISLFNYRKKKIILIFIAASIGLFSYFLYNNVFYYPALYFDGKSGEFQGIVEDIKHRKENTPYYRIKLENITESGKTHKIGGSVNLYLKDKTELDIGDQIKGFANFKNYDKDKYLIEDYNRTKGIYITGYVIDNKTIEIISKNNRKSRLFFYKIKEKIIENIYKNIENEKYAGLIVGMILGEKDYIDISIEKMFKNSGLFHIFAVSGMHLTVLSGILMIFLRFLKLGRRISSLILICFIICYAFIAGLPMSLIRSGIALILLNIGSLIGKDQDVLTSISFAGLVVVFFNPYSVGDTGFLLSFFATLALVLYNIYLKSKVENKLPYSHKFMVYITNSFLKSVLVIIFIIPITFVQFKFISIASPIGNLLISPFLFMALIAGVFIGIFGFFESIIFFPFLFIAKTMVYISITVLVVIAKFLSTLEIFNIPLGLDFTFFWLIASICLVLVSLMGKNKISNCFISIILSGVLFFVGFLSDKIIFSDISRLTMISNQGNTSFLIKNAGENILIGLSNDRNFNSGIYKYLKGKGINDIDFYIEPNMPNIDPKELLVFTDSFNIKNIVTDDGDMAEGYFSNILDLNKMKIYLKKDISLNIDIRDSGEIFYLTTPNLNIGISISGKKFDKSIYNDNLDVLMVGNNNKDIGKDFNGAIAVVSNTNGMEIREGLSVIDGGKNIFTEILISSKGKIRIRGKN